MSKFFKNIIERISSFYRAYPIATIWSIMTILIKSFISESSPLFFISLFGISFILWISYQIDSKRKRYNLCKDIIFLVFNFLIISSWFYELELNTKLDQYLLLSFLDMAYFEVLLLNCFKFKGSKLISIIFIWLFLIIKFKIQDYNLIILMISFVNGIIQCNIVNPLKNKFLNLEKENSQSNFFSNNDLLLEIQSFFHVKTKSLSFNRFLLERNQTEKEFFDILKKSLITIKKQYSFLPKIENILSDLSENQIESKNLQRFEDFMKKLFLKSDEKNCFYLTQVCMQGNESEIFFIWKQKKNIIIKIMRDFFFKEARKYHALSQNYRKATYYTAHELRNLLNSIINLENINSMSEPIAENLNQDFIVPAVASSKLMMNLANDILDIAQMEADSFKLNAVEFDLKSLMEESLKIIRFQARRRELKLVVNIDCNLKTIKSDPNRIKQIIINLLSNAIKYTVAGSITLSATQISKEKIEISVKDTGLGIDEGNIRKLFNEFSKIQNQEDATLNSQGIGLGLLISNKLANLLNNSEGGIEVTSKLNAGSIFSFKILDLNQENQEDLSVSSHRKTAISIKFLPCHLLSNNQELSFAQNFVKNSSATQEVHNFILKTEIKDKCKENFTKVFSPKNLNQTHEKIFIDLYSPSKRNAQDSMDERLEIVKKINENSCACPIALIVDDNDFNILTMGTLMKKFKIPFESAFSGDMAITKINKIYQNKCCRKFRFVFLDLEMPIKNGIETYEEICNFYKDMNIVEPEIIAVTGHSSGSEMARLAYEKGIKKMIVKPITQNDLLESLMKSSKKEKRLN